MDTPPDLRGEDFEPLTSEDTGRALMSLRERRCNGEVISRMQRNGFVDDPEVSLELFELTAHPIEAPQQCGVVDGFGRGIEKAFEGGLDDRGLACAWALGSSFQALDDLL